MKSLPPIAAASAIALLLLLIGGYVGAYLGMGECKLWEDNDVPFAIDRTYDHKLALTFFAPAAWLESKLRGVEVDLRLPYEGPFYWAPVVDPSA